MKLSILGFVGMVGHHTHERKNLVGLNHHDLSISTQLGLLSISRSCFYYVQVGES